MKRYFKTLRDLLSIANERFYIVIQMFISCGLYNIANLLPPIATSGIIAVITNNNFDGIWFYVLLYIIFYMVYFTMLNWNYHTYTDLANYYHLKVQNELFNHIVNNDSIFNKISKGKIVDTTSDDIRYLVDVIDSASKALMGLIQLIIIFIIFAYYNILVALIALLINLLYLYLMNNNSKKVSKYYEGTRKYEDKIIDMFNQMLLNLRQIKSLSLMPNLSANLDISGMKWSQEYKQKRKCLIERYCKMPYIVYGGKIILYLFLGYLVVNNKMTVDKLILLISYFELTITCTNSMLTYLLDLSNYGIRVKRIKNILDYTSNNNIDYGEINNDYINGLVTFDKVTYTVKNKDLLNNVSFKALPNEITAIVGHSGAGKTTIINLLYRLDRIKSGSILVDEESIYNYTKKAYANNVSGVFQKPFIFEMSIKENLSLVDKNIKRQIEACKRVGIHDFIESLPKGYNTVINENNRILSDGIKQLLSIARALLTKSEILLFDEVTSNVDPEITLKIADILKDLKQDHTIVLITHRPLIMEIADKIVVLDKGKVVCKGTNDEVLSKCSLYKELRNRTFASLSNSD